VVKRAPRPPAPSPRTRFNSNPLKESARPWYLTVANSMANHRALPLIFGYLDVAMWPFGQARELLIGDFG
jgi:hypothetical protein